MMMHVVALWAALAAALAPLAGGTTRFVRTSSGSIEARKAPLKPWGERALAAQRNLSAEEVLDFGFLELPGAQPLAARTGRDNAEVWRAPDIDARLQDAAATMMGRKAQDVEIRLPHGRPGAAPAVTEETLTTAEAVYLYGEAKLRDGTRVREADVPAAERHRSASGVDSQDPPDWDAMHTPWDALKAVKLRDHLEASHAEREIEGIFRDQGGVAAVRASLQAQLLEAGRAVPELWTVWNQLGNTFRATGEVTRAIQCFRRALYLKPDEPDVLLNLAVVLQNTGFLDDGERVIRHSLGIHPRGVLHHFILGNILYEQGRTGEAIRSYRRSLELQPSFIPCVKRLRDLGVDVGEPAGLEAPAWKHDAGAGAPPGPGDAGQPRMFLSHLFMVLAFLLGAIAIVGWGDDFDLDEDQAGGRAQRQASPRLPKTGNRKKAKNRRVVGQQ